MIKRYIESVQAKEPHQKRAHAMRFAVVLTGLVFVGWITTLGLRASGPVAVGEQGSFEQAAAVISGSMLPSDDIMVSETPYTGI